MIPFGSFVATVAGSSSSFSPPSIGEVKTWVKGDSASYAGVDTPGVYDHLDELGTLGGQWDKATNAQPVAVGVDGRNVPAFRGTRRFTSSLASSSYTFLHAATGGAGLAGSWYPYDFTSGAVVWGTKTADAASRGLLISVNGSDQMQCIISDGVTELTLTSTVTMTAGSHYSWVYRRSGTSVYFSVNGEAEQTATITGSSSDADHAPVIGNRNSGTSPCGGLVDEVIGYAFDPGTTGAEYLESYLSVAWSATPDWSPLQIANNLLGDWDMAANYTLNGSDISAIADQSGLNSDAVQATPSLQLARVSAWRNGRDGWQGTSSGNELLIATLTTGALAQPCTIFYLGEWGTDDRFLTATGANRIVVRGFSGQPGMFSGANEGSGTAIADGSIFAGEWEFNDASSEIYLEIDGGTPNSATGLNPGTDDGNDKFHIGGFGAGFTSDAIGSRVLLYDGVLSNTDRDAILAQLMTLGDITPA